ncbi:hypothetical protein HK104_004452 [Borealophlyctis nickersoniae]|nr:hypothetical protein HK104_004452 [Borealophlyctis nickersoniae]
MFNLLERLGEGAFGSVYKAQIRHTSATIAIKQVLIGTKSNPQETIRREIDVLRQCRHPNIVQYFGCCPVDDSIWILTDYCAAGSMSDCIQLTECTFTESQTAMVLADAVEGLAFLHSRGIVHRDVKCANILLTEEGVAKIGT